MMHDVMARILPIPRMKSMRKKNTANNCGTNVNFDIVSGYVTNTRPERKLLELLRIEFID